MPNEQERLENTLQPLLDQVQQHPLFPSINTVEKLTRFSEFHVYAVWDFMCLLKTLQRQLVSTNEFWLPPSNYLGCHLVNHLIAEEESDVLADGRYLSHFDLYLEAMTQCGADTKTIEHFLMDIRGHLSGKRLLREYYHLPSIANQFIKDTFSLFDKGVHMIAASFAYAREAITSGMFSPILEQLQSTAQVDKFIEYFQRHIELDSGKHLSQAKLLVASLCGNDTQKWQEALGAAQFSLNSRLRFLDHIFQEINRKEA